MSSELRREIGALCLLAATIFTAVALASYREADSVGSPAAAANIPGVNLPGGIFPGGTFPGANLCGSAGYVLASFLLHGFGYASWILVFCLGFWGVARFVGRQLKIHAARTIGLWTLVLAASALLAHFFHGSSTRLPDPGGYVGLFLEDFLVSQVSLGTAGARILLVFLVVVALMLATDFLFYGSIRALLARWRERLRNGARESDSRRQASCRESVSSDSPGESEAEDPRAEGEPGEDLEDLAFSGAAPEPPLSESPGEAGNLAESRWPPTYRPGAWARLATLLKGVSSFFTGGRPASPSVPDAMGETRAGLDTRREAEVGAEPDDKEAPSAPLRAELEDGDGERAGEGAVPGVDSEPRARKVKGRRPRGGSAVDALPQFDREAVHIAPPPASREHPYVFPALDILEPHPPVATGQIEKHTRECSRILEQTLASFRIEAEVADTCRGPVVTMYEMELAPGTKVDRIRALEDELAMALKVRKVRIVAPLPGKSTVGIEVPNAVRETVTLRELLESSGYQKRNLAIPVMLGKDVAGNPLVDDLARMPHLLVAGATGSGKSVCLNSIIMSLLFTRTPDQIKLILIDPKMVELSAFAKIAHLLCPVVTDIKRVPTILEWAVGKMEARYDVLHRVGVRNIYAFNELSPNEIAERLGRPPDSEDETRMPFVVIIVDELADLMMASGKEVETLITRLAQKSRAVGIHVILATQRPSTNVITGLIKANMPTRISFMVASKVDSRVVLDVNGAEKLIGAGDMLYLTPRCSDVIRAQCSYVDDREIRDVVRFLRETCAPEYSRELVQERRALESDPAQEDDLWEEAVRFVLSTQRGSASLLQRRFKIGYTRASRLIDLMGEEGLLGDFKGSQAREVLCSLEEWEERRARESKAVS
ncbi:MAG: DNA translocase FtsK 4TM domain-containing protein [Planctomycetota bacterium]